MRLADRIVALRYPVQRRWASFRTKYLVDFIFVHINKTGGSSIERALHLPFQHRTAAELRADLGPDRWERRFSFGFVRNPWDKVVSHYHFRVKTNQTGLRDHPLSFEEWVLRAYGDADPRYCDDPRMFMPQHEWLCDADGKLLVDFVGRFESLADDFETVCRRLNRDARLPHLKRSTHRDFRELYSPRTRDLIADRFAGDLKRFGYSFE